MFNITKPDTSATVIPVIKGSGVANREASKGQLAALAAGIAEGDFAFKPSMVQLARLFGVSVNYIKAARKLPPGKRKAVAKGDDWVSFSTSLHPPKAQLALPAPKVVTDEALEQMIRVAGIERMLNIAIAVETHAT